VDLVGRAQAVVPFCAVEVMSALAVRAGLPAYGDALRACAQGPGCCEQVLDVLRAELHRKVSTPGVAREVYLAAGGTIAAVCGVRLGSSQCLDEAVRAREWARAVGCAQEVCLRAAGLLVGTELGLVCALVSNGVALDVARRCTMVATA